MLLPKTGLLPSKVENLTVSTTENIGTLLILAERGSGLKYIDETELQKR